MCDCMNTPHHMGSTGYQPVPSGDPPDGMEGDALFFRALGIFHAPRRAVRPLAGRGGLVARATLLCLAAFWFFSASLAHADDTNAFSPIISYQYLDALDAPGASNTVSSPLVSYQYEDALNAPGSETTIISPIVSYQYYDWPGNENVSLQASPTVSYFYQGGAGGGAVAFQGRVVDAQGQPVGQAVVEARVMESPAASATTGADGRYILPPLPRARTC